MEVLLVSAGGVERRSPEELDELLAGPGLVWVDVPAWDDEAAAVLPARFGFHERAGRGVRPAQPVPKVHVHPGHVFVVLHAPERGARGHVPYVELDQFVGPNWLITVHGPVNRLSAARSFSRRAGPWRAASSGRLHPSSAGDLSFSLVTALTGRDRGLLSALTEEVWQLERQVTGGQSGDPEQFLEELFAVRHGLLAIRTMAALSREVYERMATLDIWPGPGRALLLDLEDQFRRIGAMVEGQREYLLVRARRKGWW